MVSGELVSGKRRVRGEGGLGPSFKELQHIPWQVAEMGLEGSREISVREVGVEPGKMVVEAKGREGLQKSRQIMNKTGCIRMCVQWNVIQLKKEGILTCYSRNES